MRNKGFLSWLSHQLLWDPPHRRFALRDRYYFCSPFCPYCADDGGFLDGVDPDTLNDVRTELGLLDGRD